jgi:hypothetical protein
MAQKNPIVIVLFTMKLLHFLYWLLFLTCPAVAQKAGDFTPVTHRIVIHNDTSAVEAEVLHAEEKIRIRNSTYYTWVAGGRIHVTKGGYDGRLLHGPYAMFTYPEKNLVQKGSFHNGAKSGLWTTWYPNGEVKENMHWKAGKRNGSFEEFNDNGFRSRQGRYRNNELNGLVRVYVSKDSAQVVRMKNGERVTTAKWYSKFQARINKGTKNLFRPRKHNNLYEPAAPQGQNP